MGGMELAVGVGCLSVLSFLSPLSALPSPFPFLFPVLTADILVPQIIDGIVTLVVSFAGLILIPDFPSKPKYVFRCPCIIFLLLIGSY